MLKFYVIEIKNDFPIGSTYEKIYEKMFKNRKFLRCHVL